MEKKIILCKNYDDIIWFDGTRVFGSRKIDAIKSEFLVMCYSSGVHLNIN